MRYWSICWSVPRQWLVVCTLVLECAWEALEQAGYDVEQAKDGQEGVDKLLGGLKVCAVLCDVEMPRLDGYGVLDEIKSRSEFADLPIMMLTSRNNEKHRKLAMNLGASAYFSKPYNEQELLQTLKSLV